MPIGWKAKGSSFMANVFPRFNKWCTANVSQKYQMEMGPKFPDTQGSIYQPMSEGRGVDDKVDERKENKKENRYERVKNKK